MKKLRLGLTGLLFFTLFSGLVSRPIVTQAASPNIVISEVQTGGSGSGTSSQEFVELYNNSNKAVNVTGWEVVYSSASDVTQKTLVELDGQLAANGFLLLGSTVYTAPANTTLDATFTAGLASDGGHIKVYDSSKALVDKLGWGMASNPETKSVAAPSGGTSAQRIVNEEQLLVDTDSNFLDFITSMQPNPMGGWLEPIVVVPDPQPITYPTVFITELLPDPSAPALDEESEFIELYNPNTESVNLSGYALQTGGSYQYSFIIPATTIPAGGYLTLYSKDTKLTLSNSGSQARVLAPDGSVIDETDPYTNVPEGESWALLSGNWSVSNQVTPGTANLSSVVSSSDDSAEGKGALGSCPSGKYRNPLTNRCKMIETAPGLKPCAPDQYRNPLTNRCKKKVSATTSKACAPGKYRNPATNRCKSFVSAATSLKPCNPGQFRNPLTNRCKKIGSGNNVLKPCNADQERNPETNRCRKVAGASINNPLTTAASTTSNPKVSYPILVIIGVLALGYGLFEYRVEFINLWAKLLKKR